MALLLLVVLLMFTVSFPGVNHGLSQMEICPPSCSLAFVITGKILRGRLKSPGKAQRFGSHSQMRHARWRTRTLACTHARRGLARRERLISPEISELLWSRSLLLPTEARGRPSLRRPLVGVIAGCVPDKRTRRLEPLPAAATV